MSRWQWWCTCMVRCREIYKASFPPR